MSCKRTARRPPTRLRISIDSMAFGGEAVGREPDGRVVFVAGGAPGDVVSARVVEEHRGWLRAELERVIEPGAGRAEAPCRHFREAACGGCQWQQVTWAAQRLAKQEIVARALRRELAAVEPIGSPVPPERWRRRARLRLRSGALGYRAWRSHRLVDVESCLQLEAVLEAALEPIRTVIATRLAGGGEVELLATGRGEIHALVEARGARALAAELAAGACGLAGVILREPDQPDLVVGAAEVDLADDARPFLARADLFAQASSAGNAALRQLVATEARTDGRVLELFAGSGNFTRDLVGAEVVAVEGDARAAAVGARNAPGARWLGEPVERVLAALAGPWDVLVVDPPRGGFTEGLAEKLATVGAQRIVYVSCDPATLGRDLATLREAGGYKTLRAWPLDLMPQTFHVETVAVLERA